MAQLAVRSRLQASREWQVHSKRTVIWQTQGLTESDWIQELFGNIFGEYIVDGDHEVVADHCLLIDSSIARHDPAYYARFRGMDAFLLHLSDETYEGGYCAYDHFRGVFRTYWSSVFRPERVLSLPLGYGNGLRSNGSCTAAAQRPYNWSFLGQVSKASRPDMVKALTPIAPHYCHATDGIIPHIFPQTEYQHILLSSAFAPCPMGNVNLDSYRVYEALEAGAIPIVERRLTLDYFHHLLGKHPLPTLGSWGEARRLIQRLTKQPQTLNELQRQCIEWWEQYKGHLREQIALFIQDCSSQDPWLSATSFWYRLPFWRILELCRHHSLAAIRRRISRQLSRVI